MGKTILVKQYRKAIEKALRGDSSREVRKGREWSQSGCSAWIEEEIATADLELLYDFILPLIFVSGLNSMVRPTWKRWKIHHPQDADETLELFEVTFEDLIQAGEICDAKTIMAIHIGTINRGGSGKTFINRRNDWTSEAWGEDIWS